MIITQENRFSLPKRQSSMSTTATRERKGHEKRYKIVPSQFGDIAVVWQGPQKNSKVIRILLPVPETNMKQPIRQVYLHARQQSTPLIKELCRNISMFLSGKMVVFGLDYLDLLLLYEFQRRVLLTERKVPYGRVTTYGRLAEKIGAPRAARAVGTALARNPFPLVIPCHRTIRSDGSLGGYGGGIELKRVLLELEGVKFDRKGRVLMVNLW